MSSVIIVGGGIVGCAVALELTQAGWQVTLIERDCLGSGATAAGMGHIVVMDEGEAQLKLTLFGQQLWQALTADHPQPHEYHACGTLWVATDTEEWDLVAEKAAVYQQYQIACEILDAAALYAHEPALREGLVGGLLVPNDSVVYPPKSAVYLWQQAEKHGATLVYGEVTTIQTNYVQLNDGRQLSADAIVVANGQRCIDLLPELPIRAKRGQLVITERYPALIKHQLVELSYIKNAHASSGDSVAFNLQPRPNGQLLIGSSRQFDRTDRQIDQLLLSQMLRKAIDYVPALADVRCLRTWTGVRAASPDGLPLIGQHPERAGLWLNVGHEGLGITTALSSARLLADQMLQRQSQLEIQPYLPRSLQQEQPQ
ncbi:MAG TPA: FAD-binding oxidoreductase [Herpetosiphon sp.]|uniref:FAD dependent oxidoreductase n=1 Tax=Herpetosiphon aurantiacus (strain ATCC 23779 / DSM 785 / 114-95) TaxID=316274 RepID=A9AZJ4_HERA2|nr:FAD-dependent oxidoreductase [Herpetosiphon sp.]ABX05138.1 FAD dependent oxidoreductase [Herpetosiphon aurantiacus DSM 785]HBW51418.1 FAD-binding oxidoreductase [Herpetosiphon sp.]